MNFEGSGMYVIMYVENDTDNREAVMIHSEIEFNEVVNALSKEYSNVEIHTLENAKLLGLYNLEV
ncbi:hypothetical protein [Niallia taxi]|uniref:hypothetical protein n=1 Tax=Niallia taxi TaxID=2499688 RepID=UPI0015F60DA6|nr:hypothetical protein [Niallia taxi]